MGETETERERGLRQAKDSEKDKRRPERRESWRDAVHGV